MLGTAVLVATFAVCNYVFDMYWAVTLSLCIAYAGSIDEALRKVLLRSRRPVE